MSITNITYLQNIIPNDIIIINNPCVNRLYFIDFLEIKKFLLTLENDKVYVITFDFILTWLLYEENSPVINLSKPILITKNSNPRLLSNFIVDRIKVSCENYFLDEDIMEMLIKPDGPGVLAKYKVINLF